MVTSKDDEWNRALRSTPSTKELQRLTPHAARSLFGIFTHDIDKAMWLADELNTGGTIIKGVKTWRVDHMPYGGVGESGAGREGGRHMIEEHSEPKIVALRNRT